MCMYYNQCIYLNFTFVYSFTFSEKIEKVLRFLPLHITHTPHGPAWVTQLGRRTSRKGRKLALEEE